MDGEDFAAKLSPGMPRSEMDAFLLGIGAKQTPFSVSDMFCATKDKDTRKEIVEALQLDNAPVAARLKIGLRNAERKPTPRAVVPRLRPELDAATAHRLEELGQASAGSHTSIFGKDTSGRPLDKDGNVQVQAVSWDKMLDGPQSGVRVRGGVAWSGRVASVMRARKSRRPRS